MKTCVNQKMKSIAVAFVLLLSVLTNVKAASIVITNNAAVGAGSLNDAILWVNANTASAPHTITFSDALDGLLIPSILLRDLACPNVTIDGTTMTGYTCKNPRVMIFCNGANGWEWTSSGCTIKGVRIFGGISLNGTGGHKVLSCLFNIDFAGAAMASSAAGAVRTNAAGSINNIVGGLTNCEGNVFAAIGARAVYFDAGGTGSQVLGNYMGTEITGVASLGTGFTTRVIEIANGNNLIFDGNTMGKVLGGAQGQAIFVNGGTGHTIRNNNIGANVSRLFIPGLSFAGSMAIYFNGNGDNSTLTNNVIGNCIVIASAGIAGNVITVESADNVNLINNYIGCDINFNNGGSSWAGVYYYSGSVNATISGNYIGYNGRTSAQRSHGIALFNIGGTFNVTNNYIGVTPTGGDMGNGDAGLEMNTSSAAYVLNITGNYVGFNKCMRATAPGSLTSESGGIRIIEGETVTISNNYIGTIAGGRLDCGNSANGIGIEGATTNGITINNNVIAYNKKNGIHTYGNGNSDKVLISQNCMFCNTYEGIELARGTLGTPSAGTGNLGYGRSFATLEGPQPVSISTSGVWASNFSGNPYILRGYAPVGSTVEIFQNHHCNCDATSAFAGLESAGGRMQGIDYIATVIADANGHWTYNLPTTSIKNGITVTASDLTLKRTSEFSPCVSVTQTCIPPVTVSTTGPASLAPCVGDPFSIGGGATFVRASCYNNIYYSWLKNGVVIYGPSLVYVPYSVVAAADPADDGNYQLRVEDGNAALAACYKQSSPAVAVDVVVCPPLYINLLSFTGLPYADRNVLSWSINADEFATVELQSAGDGINFSTIYNTGIYASTTERHEDFTNAAVMYYRLKITPANGKFYYSSTITLTKITDIDVTVLSTKVDEVLNIQATSNSDQAVKYVIYDVKGVLVASGSIQVSAGVTNHAIPVQALPSAMYLIRFETGNGYINAERFIK